LKIDFRGTTVSGTATATVGQPVAPATVTVTPSAVYVAQDGQQQFSVTVGPLGAPQAVIWSIEPAGAGTITTGGLLTVTNADAGEVLTITATAVNHPTVAGTATVTVPEPITITITGIPTEYHHDWIRDLHLRQSGNTRQPNNNSQWLEGPSVTFTFEASQIPGDYEVSLTLRDWNHYQRVYRITSRNITAGTNTIPLSEFTFVPPITITVTGIPNGYHSSNAGIELRHPVTDDWIGDTWGQIEGSSAEFIIVNMNPGTYSVNLVFSSPESSTEYRITSRNITAGTNTISYSAFTLHSHREAINITVTGIPVEYNNHQWNISLSGHNRREGHVEGSSVTFAFSLWNVHPGIHYLEITLDDGNWNNQRSYRITSRNITSGNNTIPFNNFTPGYIDITVTGIPAEYQGNNGSITFWCPVTDSQIDWGYVLQIEGSSATVTIHPSWGSVEPGMYDLGLAFGGRAYTLSSRNITAGANTILFNELIPAYITITVTGISIPHSEWTINLLHPITGNTVTSNGFWVDTGSSATVTLRTPDWESFTTSGVYNVELIRMWWGWPNTYTLSSRNITLGANTILFSDFTLQD
jgi:hypothetical protein